MGITRSGKLLAINNGNLHIKVDTSIKTLEQYFSKKQNEIKIPSDDSSAYTFAPSLKAVSSEYSKGIVNVNQGSGALAVAQEAIKELQNILIKKSNVASVAGSSSSTKEAKEAAKEEFDALGEEFDRIIDEAEFNGIHVLSGGLDSLAIQAGDDQIIINLKDEMEDLPEASGEDTEVKVSSSNSNSTQVARTDGGYAAQVALADFNGDGILDMAVSDYGSAEQCGAGGYSNTISVSWGTGSGTFSNTTSFSLGSASRPYSIKVADVNNDGKMDIVAGTMQDDKVYVLKGTGSKGSGGFSSPTKISTYARTLLSVGVGDVNGDNKEDIVAVGRYNASSEYKAFTYAGNGSGSFTAVGNSSGGATVGGEGCFSIEVEDFNNDNKDDAVIANRNTNSFSVLMSDGTKLTNGVVYQENAAVYDVAVGDLNKDGVKDIAVAVGNKVAVYHGAGDGTFNKAYEYEAGETVTSVALGDINGDGDLDIVSAAGKSKELVVKLSKGDGTFYSETFTDSSKNAVDVAVGDLNKDGNADVVTADSSAKTATAYIATTCSLNVDTEDNARYAAEKLLTLAEKLEQAKSAVKGYEDRMDIAMSTLESSRAYYSEAYDKIANADVAEVAANTIKDAIMQDTRTALLAHSRVSTESLTKLICENIIGGEEVDQYEFLKMALTEL